MIVVAPTEAVVKATTIVALGVKQQFDVCIPSSPPKGALCRLVAAKQGLNAKQPKGAAGMRSEERSAENDGQLRRAV